MNKDYIFKRRLLKLADHLDDVPRNKFDYNSYVGEDWGGKANLSCGTTACALGWATTIPSFRRLGLYLNDNFDVDIKNYNGLNSDMWGSPAIAASIIFGLKENEFEYLFIPRDRDLNRTPPEFKGIKPGENATPKQVAKHIRQFVKRKYG